MKKFTRLSMFLAISIVLNIIESFMPVFNGIVPGLKLGLANIVTIYVLYKYGLKEACYIGILRVFLVGIMRTGLFNSYFFFSLSGCIFSILAMYLSYKYLKLSVIGVSIMGSIFHSIGQILISILIIQMTQMIFYLPVVLIFSIPTGIITGFISKKIINIDI